MAFEWSELHQKSQTMQEQKKANLVAEWEHKTQQRGQWLNRSREQEDAAIERQTAMEQKRAKLAEKLRNEELQYQQEILQQQVMIDMSPLQPIFR